MAKRRRLTPFGAGFDDAGFAASGLPPDAAPQIAVAARPPIADMAGAAAATAALEEMAETLRHAREGGRMVLALPLDQIEAGYLVRDRIAADPEEMAALIESLRARGQQTPIEVVQLAPDRFGLISGWRRLTALRQLDAETADPRFATVLALLRRPDQASDAYVAMVEENEIRVGLSFYERARIVAKAVEAGVYPDDRAALRGLFGAASRPRRSKIGSFLVVVRALDGALRFPEAIGERLGLQLAQALGADPGLSARLAARLAAAPPVDAAAEQALIARGLAGGQPGGQARGPLVDPAGDPAGDPAAEQAGEQTADRAGDPVIDLWPGLRLRQKPGRIVIEGPEATGALAARLADWLRQPG